MDDRLPKDTLDAKLADFNTQKEKLLTQSKETEYETSIWKNSLKMEFLIYLNAT